MFSRYWADRYFAPRYWPNDGDVIVIIEPTADVTVIVRARVRTVNVEKRPDVLVTSRPDMVAKA